MKAKLTFHGGVGMVTGANFLLEAGGAKTLVDCGFFQGCNVCDTKNLAPFPYEPASVNTLLVTHAHLDHTGRIPILVRKGFRGKILSTPPTKEIAELMFQDSVGILANEAKEGGYEPAYTEEDIAQTLSLWETSPYHTEITLGGGLAATFKDAGHILGSALVEIRGEESGKKILFTGDMGNSPMPLLRDTELVTDAAYAVIESVYGDREHDNPELRRDLLEDVIEETVTAGGALLIPAFSVERTQEILFEIERMMEEHKIPRIPVFLDSPLAIKVTEVYKKYEDYLKKNADKGGSALSFPQLAETSSVKASKEIQNTPNPKIIIAGSGMSNGGRILFHEKEHLPDSKSTLLIVSYQAPGSMGRELQEGVKSVTIFGKKVPVRARVVAIEGYSAHGDLNTLTKFVAGMADTVQSVFVVMGEPKAASFLAQRLRDYVGVNAHIPAEGESVELEL